MYLICHYYNNNKSNTFDSEIFKKYFAPKRRESFENLAKEFEIIEKQTLKHNLKK